MVPNSSESWFNAERFVPQASAGVLVQCEGFRCLAYQDPRGTWRSFFNGEALPLPLEVVEAVMDAPQHEMAIA